MNQSGVLEKKPITSDEIPQIKIHARISAYRSKITSNPSSEMAENECPKDQCEFFLLGASEVLGCIPANISRFPANRLNSTVIPSRSLKTLKAEWKSLTNY